MAHVKLMSLNALYKGKCNLYLCQFKEPEYDQQSLYWSLMFCCSKTKLIMHIFKWILLKNT